MKLITSLLVLCMALSVGLALAQTDASGNTDNMSGMDNMTGNVTCSVSGIMTLIPETLGNMTGTDSMTGSQEGSNMTGMGDMTGPQTYSITATIECMPAMIDMTEGAQAGNMTENMTGMDNMTDMDNMTETKMCFITGNATSMPTGLTLAENMTDDNMTDAQTYSIIATVECMPRAMADMTEGAQAGNMTENMNGINMTGVQKYDINGIMTLIPANMTQAGNMTEMGNIPGTQTYSITATVECMQGAMSNMTEGAQAGNMTENMTDMDNMTENKMCFITGNATSMPADITQVETMNADNMTDTGNMTGAQTHSFIATVDVECMPGAMANMTGNMINITGVPQEKNIIETAEDAGNFTTLLTALNAANLTYTLKGDGPFTVFAPTDEAFASLPAGTIEALLNDTSTLTNILHYHVAGQKLMAKDVVNMSNIITLEGRELPINATDEGVFVGNAKIIMTDIDASNGVIHAIDAVLIPPEVEGQTAANMTETQAENMATNTSENTTDGQKSV